VNSKIVDAGKNTRFKPGQSGNPAGRPRRTSITDLLSFVLTLRPNALKLVRPAVRANFPEAKTDAHALAMSLIIKAANKGDLATWREIREIVEGKTRCLAPDFLDTELSVFMQRLRVQEAADELELA